MAKRPIAGVLQIMQYRLIRDNIAIPDINEYAILGAVEDRSSIDRDRNFRKRIEFNIYNRQRKISNSFKERAYPLDNISGFLFSVDSLVEA